MSKTNNEKSSALLREAGRAKIIVAVSGGFDPLHIGHTRLFTEAKKRGDELVVILNNDNWLKAKKGFVFMRERERKEIIEAIAGVGRVVLTRHKPNPKDMSVCRELKKLRPDIFVNGGDRRKGNLNDAETIVCKRINCKMMFHTGSGGKIQSSSWLLDKYKKLFKSDEKVR